MDNQQIGRILRASTTGFVTGCRVSKLTAPAFGSLVKAQPVDAREAIYGLIYDMHIDDDPLVRRLILAESPAEAVINDQRENRLLPVEMSVLAVGYGSGNGHFDQLSASRIRHALPPRPPLNLDPVLLCLDKQEVLDFTAHFGYFRLILRTAQSGVPVEQLLVAHILHVHETRQDDAWVMAAITELIELLRSSYEMLIPTLEALSDAFPNLPLALDKELPF
jgi:hypothetical protein